MGNIQNQFLEKIGEVAYSSSQIVDMLDEMGLNWYSETQVRDYIKKCDLSICLEKLGIQTRNRMFVKYWVPKSNLIKIIKGMNIPASEKDFEDAAHQLNYQL